MHHTSGHLAQRDELCTFRRFDPTQTERVTARSDGSIIGAKHFTRKYLARLRKSNRRILLDQQRGKACRRVNRFAWSLAFAVVAVAVELKFSLHLFAVAGAVAVAVAKNSI